MTLDEFFTSIHHTEHSNERFGYWQYFMHAEGDETIAEFLRDLLSAVGDSVDDADFGRVVDLIKSWDRRYAAWFVENHPYTRQVVNDQAPWAPLKKPLAESRVALICSGGFFKDADEPHGPGGTPTEQATRWREFFESHPTYRSIPKDYPRDRIRVSHPSYDHSAVREDINVLFPLDRFQELEREGVIGELAPTNYSYMGLTNHRRVSEELVPKLVDELARQEVDAAFLTPA